MTHNPSNPTDDDRAAREEQRFIQDLLDTGRGVWREKFEADGGTLPPGATHVIDRTENGLKATRKRMYGGIA